jgi:hypothetical protein
MNYLRYAETNLRKIAESPAFIQHAKNNPYAEVEYAHALDVSKLTEELWLRKFEIKPPVALKIAGLSHDFDRFFPKESIDSSKSSGEEYKNSKLEHSKNSARIFRRENPKLPVELKDDVVHMIERHEIGGDKVNGRYVEILDRFTSNYNLNVSSDQLNEADGLSFFSVIIPSYRKWAPPERVINKIRFSFSKLSPVGQQMVREMEYSDEEIRNLILSTVGKS